MLNKLKVKVKKKIIRKHHNTRKINKNNHITDYIKEELLNSTTHGLPYTVNPNIPLIERIFWIISFSGSVVLLSILLSAQYTRYIESPTVMSIEMNYFDWNISFPAITLCPLHKTDVGLFNSLVNETLYRTGLKTDPFFWGIVSGGMDNLNILYLNIPENVSALVPPQNYSRLAAELFRKFPNNSLTTNTNWSIPLETAMTEVGMCHVINSNVAVYDNPIKWGRKAEYTKTNIELTIYEGDFLAQITNYSINYKVYIHHPDELVLSTSPSFTFDVEGTVTFGLSVWSTRIAEELRPKSTLLRKCRFVNEPLSKRYPVYSYNHCILECRIGIIIQLCGCVPHFYKPLGNERVCSINELECVLKYKKEIMSLTIPNYILRIFKHSKKLTKSPRDCGCLSNCETDIYHKDNEVYIFEKSIGRLQMGITKFPKIRVVRDIIFNLNDIFLRSGGVINLFIGSSIISMVELVLFLIKLFIKITIALYDHLKM
ncbi:pickpocket protein 28-like [Epargyreus clarus]|uniref:pickpocket protein 28-like n=1 Tax=Epargyreus clarus TaxID=520877 RepID=UPI003C2B2D66